MPITILESLTLGLWSASILMVYYNGVLTGISLSGDNYTYQNPLNSASHSRWEWHDCPCCPPMFLKFMGNMPENIYSHKGDEVYVNLYAASSPAGHWSIALKVLITKDLKLCALTLPGHCREQKIWHRSTMRLQ